MKDILKVVLSIILVIIITLICCILFLKPKLNFKETSEFKYIESNKDNIDEIIVRTVTLIGEHCYKIDINKGYDILNNIEVKKQSKFRCTDSDMYIDVYFKNGTSKELLFECNNLVYDNISYELKDEVILFNKDVYVPNEITKNMIIISNEDKIECK